MSLNSFLSFTYYKIDHIIKEIDFQEIDSKPKLIYKFEVNNDKITKIKENISIYKQRKIDQIEQNEEFIPYGSKIKELDHYKKFSINDDNKSLLFNMNIVLDHSSNELKLTLKYLINDFFTNIYDNKSKIKSAIRIFITFSEFNFSTDILLKVKKCFKGKYSSDITFLRDTLVDIYLEISDVK